MPGGRYGVQNQPGFFGFDVNAHQIPVVGNFFSNPLEEHKLEAMHQAGQAFQQYRPQYAAASTNAMNQTLGQFAPINNAITAMYGAAYTTPTNVQNPFAPEAFQTGDIGKPPRDTGILDQAKDATGGWVSGYDLLMPGSTATAKLGKKGYDYIKGKF
jgi:hypothetical protein